jgi:hypothetical protein
MIKNEPSRDPKAKLEDFVSTLQNWSDYLLSQLPEGESSLAENLRELSNGDLASSEDKLVGWLGELKASIQSSNCGSEYCSILGSSLVRALVGFVKQKKPSKEVVDACKQCLVATFDKILDTSLTPNAPETKETEQQAESLQRFKDAFWLLVDVASLVKETSVFDPNEVKLIMTRTAELLNFSPRDINLGEERRENEEKFFRLVAGQIIPYMMGQKEIAWEDQTMNYPKKLKEYLRPLKIDRPQTGLLIEKFLAVLNQRDEAVLAQQDGIVRLYEALQTQASGSQ